MNLKSKTFCALPWLHLEARTDGRVSPCCLSREVVKKDDGNTLFLYRDNIQEAYNSKWMSNLRSSLDSGKKHSNCEVCWQDESIGQHSRRQRENDRFKHKLLGFEQSDSLPDQPIFLDLKLGNLCNLKCRICGPYSSVKWVQESVDLYGEESLPHNQSEIEESEKSAAKNKMMTWDENPTFWTTLTKWLPQIENFEIFGGEPFLIKRHFDVLKLSIEGGYSKNQSLHYNTNGTVYPEDAIKNIFPHFKRVNVMFSLDGINDQFEYQRFPAKWTNALENLFKFKQSVNVEICLTISALNIYYLDTYLEFWSQYDVPIYLNVLNTPVEYNYQILPNEFKDIIINKFKMLNSNTFKKNILNHLPAVIDGIKAKDLSPAFQKFIETTQRHDKYRNQSFQKAFPEFYEILLPHIKTLPNRSL